ncbi:MAG: DUF3524 domain-containing protein [Bacteroidota bacterium]
MKIVLIEPFYTASHRQWADGLKKYSRHQITLLTLPGRYWKWRMHGGAVTLAKAFLELPDLPDLIVVSDMLDVTVFKALTQTKVPIVLYFHENQLTYPWSPKDLDVQQGRDNHYSFINYTSALVADRVFFNSVYHRDSFLHALPKFLQQFPDYPLLDSLPKIIAKSQVLYLGLELQRFDDYVLSDGANIAPIIVWNHRNVVVPTLNTTLVI